MSPVLASKNTHFDALLRGPSSRGVSSHGLQWQGILIERHSVEPDERPESISEEYILGSTPGARMAHAEARKNVCSYWRERGSFLSLLHMTPKPHRPPTGRIASLVHVNITGLSRWASGRR